MEVQDKTKVCFKCCEAKSLSEFYKHPRMGDGHLNKCKDCTKNDTRENYRNNFNYYREYESKRAKNRWGYIAEQSRKWRNKNPEKYKAHCKVSNAIRDGRLKKQSCYLCGEEKVHAHHCDYSKPLDVIWVCAKHHQWMHPRKNDSIL